MKTALSLVAALALGCVSTAALAQQNPYGSQQQYPQSGQQGGQTYDQESTQDQQYDRQTEPRSGQDYNTNRNDPGYSQRYRNRTMSMGEGTMVSIDQGDVRSIQIRLRRNGFDPGRIDGRWGQQTASAVADFQQAHGLTATGNLNMRTIRALGLSSGQGYGGYGAHNFNNRSNSEYNNNEYNKNRYNPNNDQNDGPK